MTYKFFILDHLCSCARLVKGYIHNWYCMEDVENSFYLLLHELESEYLVLPMAALIEVEAFVEGPLESFVFDFDENFGSPADVRQVTRALIDIEIEFNIIVRKTYERINNGRHICYVN